MGAKTVMASATPVKLTVPVWVPNTQSEGANQLIGTHTIEPPLSEAIARSRWP
jgi:hypothetical protein